MDTPRPPARALAALVALLLLAPSAALSGSPQPEGAAGGSTPGTCGPTPEGLMDLATGGLLENLGQLADPGVRFYSMGSGGGVRLTDDGALHTVVDEATGSGWSVLVSPQQPSEPAGADPLPGVYNYLVGDGADRVTGARSYAEVAYRDVAEGVDLVYAVRDGALKYELRAAPGADPSAVTMRVEGHQGLRVDGSGDLVVSTPLGDLRDTGLVARYADGDREEVRCAFELRGTDGYGFRLGERDPSRPLVVDPVVYSTYVGGGAGTDEEATAGVEVDSQGRAVVAGFANTTDLPTTVGAFQVDNAGGAFDAFAMRISAAGDAMDWCTYLGGGGTDEAMDMELDAAGRPVLVGWTNSSDLPTTDGALNRTHQGADQEGFVAKLAADGASLVFLTYLGGSDHDDLTGLAIASDGDVVVCGATKSLDLPVTPGANQTAHAGGTFDAFVARLESDGSALALLTYLGASRWEEANDVDVDASGSVFVVGRTGSPDFPTTNGSFQTNLTGGFDAFVAKLTADGTALNWSTLVGGTQEDAAQCVQVDGAGVVAVAGDTKSGDFNTTALAYNATFNGGFQDAFALKLAANGSSLVASTYLGGADWDWCSDMAVEAGGAVVVAGYTLSGDIETIRGAHQEEKGGSLDAYLVRLRADLSGLLYSTYLGASGSDFAYGVAVEAGDFAYLTGGTGSPDFNVTAGALQTTPGGYEDVFVTKLNLTLDLTPPVPDAGEDLIVDMGDTVHFDGSASTDNVAVVNWTWRFVYDGTTVVRHGPTFFFTFEIAGKYRIFLTVTDPSDNEAEGWVTVYVRDTVPPVAVPPRDMTGEQHWTMTFDGSLSTDNVGVKTYNWTFEYGGANVTLSGMRVEFTFDDAGLYVVTLDVSDEEGNHDTAAFNVTIRDVTPPTAVAGEDATVDQHATVELDSNGSWDNVAISNFTWQLVYRGVPVVLYGPVASFTFDEVGVYDVSLRVLDALGNSATDVMRLTVLDITPPTAVAGPDVTIDQGQTVSMDGSGSRDNVRLVEWVWTVEHMGNETVFEGIRTSFTFATAGVHNVTLNVSDAAGNWAADAMVVTVRDVTDPIAEAGEDRTVDQGTNVTLNGSASEDNAGIASWAWSFEYGGRTLVLLGEVVHHVFEEVGMFTVTLTVTDTSGLSTSDEVRVTVLDSTPPVAVADPGRTVELGERVVFRGTASTDNVGILSYAWTFNYNLAEVTLEGDVAGHTFELVGNYTVTLTVTDPAGNTDTAETWVRVVDPSAGGDGDGDDGDGGLDQRTVLYGALAAALVVVVLLAALLVRRRQAEDFGWTPSGEEAGEGPEAEGEGTEGERAGKDEADTGKGG